MADTSKTEAANHKTEVIKQESLTRYERARLIGSRALQIAQGARARVKLSKEDLEAIGYNPISIAKIEFEKGVLPIEVRRPMPKEKEAEAKKEGKA